MTLLQFILINLNLAVFYALFKLLEHRSFNRNYNRFYLIIMPLAAILIPFISLSYGTDQIIAAKTLPIVTVMNEYSLTRADASFPGITYVYLGILLISFTLMILRLIALFRHTTPIQLGNVGNIKIYAVGADQATYSFFNKIFLNSSQLNATETKIILEHELAHCRQLHSVDTILLTLYRSLFWFNPVIYLWHAKAKENLEYLADHEVMKKQHPEQEYSQLILNTVFNTRVPGLGNGFNGRSTTYKRIMNLNRKNQNNMKHLFILPITAALLFLSTSVQKVNSDPAHIATKNFPEDSVQADEVPAQFPGGQEALMNYMIAELKYPGDLAKEKIEGMVYVAFQIEKDGTVMRPEVKKTSGYEAFDQEALRVIANMPDWVPGQKDGQNVKTEMVLPFKFKL